MNKEICKKVISSPLLWIVLTVISLMISVWVGTVQANKTRAASAKQHEVFEIFTNPENNKTYLITNKVKDWNTKNTVGYQYQAEELCVSILYEEYPTSVTITIRPNSAIVTNMIFNQE
jgi:membrane glycosyltransferase